MSSEAPQRAAALQEELRDVLVQSPPDYARVLALSTELAKLDPDNVRFFADAGLVSRLGTELVSRKETALAELVKNAYDADATRVDVLFEEADAPGGRLEISDNGTGMARKTLVEGFMRLSSTIKEREPISPRYKRQRAGRKGIGRFAVQRLGRYFEVTTQTIDSSRALRVRIDWDEFTGGTDLTSIASRIDEVEKARPEGTVLVIEDLRDGWTDATIRRAFRYVSDLLQPFPIKALTHDAEARAEADPGFEPHFFRSIDGDVKTVADEQGQFLDLALAVIRGRVDEQGRGAWSITSTQFPDADQPFVPIGKDPNDPTTPFSVLQDVEFEAYYYIEAPGLIPRASGKTIREWLLKQGGIRVYRNGFRVYPYGEPTNDWLGNNYIESKRLILPPFSNTNFYGIVELTDPGGVRFEETASREGLVQNNAFEELATFVQRVLRAGVLRVAEARNKRTVAPGREAQKETPPKERVIEAARLILEGSGEDETTREQAKEILRGVEEMVRAEAVLLNELGMLRVLASLGLVIGEFTHEIRHILPAVVSDAWLLKDALAGGPDEEMASDLFANVSRFQTYASYFDRSVRDNASREVEPQEVGAIVEEFARVIAQAAGRRAIRIATDVEGAGLFSTPMHASEWTSILYNFYSNAQKAIARERPASPQVLLRAGRTDDTVFVEVADNGDGILEENSDRVFNAFYTTSTASGDPFGAEDDVAGSGLGLKIIRDIAHSYGGQVYTAPPPPTYRTLFRFEVPQAQPEDFVDE